MNIKWAIHDHDKTWVESGEDINIVADLSEEDDEYENTYVIQGNIENPDKIRKDTGVHTYKPDVITRKHKTYFVAKWKEI